jgi:hypothetical protein
VFLSLTSKFLYVGENVLDLCCAPGAKLTMLADLMGRRGTLTGVDISRNRLAAAGNVLVKYGVVGSSPHPDWHCRVFLEDGTCFAEGHPQAASLADERLTHMPYLDSFTLAHVKGAVSRVRKNKSWRARDARAEKLRAERGPGAQCVGQAPCCEPCPESRYDRVLVDAECTHDGSFKHLHKYRGQWGMDSFERRVLDQTRLADLQALQRGLLRWVRMCSNAPGRGWD